LAPLTDQLARLAAGRLYRGPGSASGVDAYELVKVQASENAKKADTRTFAGWAHYALGFFVHISTESSFNSLVCGELFPACFGIIADDRSFVKSAEKIF
jgi:hypothetical protein